VKRPSISAAISLIQPDSAYLALHAPLFTEAEFAVALERAMDQFNMLKLSRIATRTLSYLLRYIDAMRDVGRLEKIYRTVRYAYGELATANPRDIRFAGIGNEGKRAQELADA
jgi:hypothetical protein